MTEKICGNILRSSELKGKPTFQRMNEAQVLQESELEDEVVRPKKKKKKLLRNLIFSLYAILFNAIYQTSINTYWK